MIDATVGLGGHALELLQAIRPKGRLIAIDLDPENLAQAREKLREIGSEFELHHANYSDVIRILNGRRADAVLADLGASSPHFDDPSRGFSYRHHGPLDMRFDPTRGHSAAELLASMSRQEIADALLRWGDETDAEEIARLIVARRPIRTTSDLVEIVCQARRFSRKRALGAKLHPAARTFQALRILVNREWDHLERFLKALPQALKPGGIAVILSFHSGEDRRVKGSFRDGLRGGVYSEISPDPIRAGPDELGRNPRSKSAKLRWARLHK